MMSMDDGIYLLLVEKRGYNGVLLVGLYVEYLRGQVGIGGGPDTSFFNFNSNFDMGFQPRPRRGFEGVDGDLEGC